MRAILFLLFLFTVHVAFSATYFLSPLGNDSNNGTSAGTPWKTIAKLNQVQLRPGDIVQLQGGASFPGTIELASDDLGTSSSPIIITSYGTGRATVNAGAGYGVDANNTGGVEIRGVNFVGGGENLKSGISFYLDKADLTRDHITIEDVEINGFHDFGLMIGCTNNTRGFSNVLINRVLSHDNISGGLYTYCWDAVSFKDVNVFINKNIKISNSKAYNNKGMPGSSGHTGSGMIVSTFDGALIDSCEAYNNGENNTYGGGGPVGIWFFVVKNGIIQNSESHHNKTQTIDGGGFDLDGGCQNSIIQYCYAHDNMGPGFLMAEYGSGVPFTGNIFRYNVSENDALKSRADGNGSIYLWSTGKGSELINCEIYNNTVYAGSNCVLLSGSDFKGVKVRNNIFFSPASTSLVSASSGSNDSTKVHFVQNDYFSVSTPQFKWNGTTYSSLQAWKAVATTQERIGNTSYGMSVDPLLAASGQGRQGYKLTDNSPLIDAGLNLANIGSSDFYGGSSKIGNQDIGASERQSIILSSFKLTSFAAKKKTDGIAIQWNVNDESSVKSYTLESSTDGINFTPLYEVASLHLSINSYPYTDTRDPEMVFYRLVINFLSGQTSNSDIISIKRDDSNLTILQNPVGSSIMFKTENEVVIKVSLFNAAGAIIQTKQLAPQQGGLYTWPMTGLPAGVYYLEATSLTGQSSTYKIVKKY